MHAPSLFLSRVLMTRADTIRPGKEGLCCSLSCRLQDGITLARSWRTSHNTENSPGAGTTLRGNSQRPTVSWSSLTYSWSWTLPYSTFIINLHIDHCMAPQPDTPYDQSTGKGWHVWGAANQRGPCKQWGPTWNAKTKSPRNEMEVIQIVSSSCEEVLHF
jgi:hypothetical protein